MLLEWGLLPLGTYVLSCKDLHSARRRRKYLGKVLLLIHVTQVIPALLTGVPLCELALPYLLTLDYKSLLAGVERNTTDYSPAPLTNQSGAYFQTAMRT